MKENEVSKKKIIDGIVEYDNESIDDLFMEWWYLEGYGFSNEWLKEFENKKVRVTIELLEVKE